MQCETETYEKLLANFELLCSIMRQPGKNQELVVDLTKIEEIIRKKFLILWGKNAPEDFFIRCIRIFKSEYEKFRDFILYDKLIGKISLRLAAVFERKVQFLNALMGRKVLPADIDPSTSVPTYIVSGEKHEVMGINVFDAQVQDAAAGYSKGCTWLWGAGGRGRPYGIGWHYAGSHFREYLFLDSAA